MNQALYLFSFVRGDVNGTFLSVHPSDSVEDLRNKAFLASPLHSGNSTDFQVMYQGRRLPLHARLHETHLQSFERIDLLKEG